MHMRSDIEQGSLHQPSSIIDCDEILADNIQLLQCQRMLWVSDVSDVLQAMHC